MNTTYVKAFYSNLMAQLEVGTFQEDTLSVAVSLPINLPMEYLRNEAAYGYKLGNKTHTCKTVSICAGSAKDVALSIGNHPMDNIIKTPFKFLGGLKRSTNPGILYHSQGLGLYTSVVLVEQIYLQQHATVGFEPTTPRAPASKSDAQTTPLKGPSAGFQRENSLHGKNLAKTTSAAKSSLRGILLASLTEKDNANPQQPLPPRAVRRQVGSDGLCQCVQSVCQCVQSVCAGAENTSQPFCQFSLRRSVQFSQPTFSNVRSLA
ncbi:hypothetical protein Bbelb_371250 [Branchiostoma belcheri]|nr:hypothetical protein Bbelb_371250 [Branchiostoma belcheri]